MSKISKALEKYKKEHNLTSAQIFNLEKTIDPSQKPLRRFPSLPIEERDSTPKVIEKNFQSVAHSSGQQPAPSSEPTGFSPPQYKFAPELVSHVKPGSVESELFKVLRGKILFPTVGRLPKSILITSAEPGEGKSFVASNLSVNLASSIGNHVLLADCDTRRPTIHKLFGFGKVKGLVEYLAEGAGLTSLLLKTGIDKLTILPSGEPPANPSELLSSAKMAALIEQLKVRYDDRFLIIDSPPPFLAPESIAIAKKVDGIIIVIKYGSTPFHLVEELIENLGRDKILGAVLNRFESRVSARYYGYGKYGKYYRNKNHPSSKGN